MIVWGGVAEGPTYFNTGGKYDPSTDGSTTTNTSNAPSARYGHTAVWTGNEMIVWGDCLGRDQRHEQFQYWREVLRAYGKTYANAASAPDASTETIGFVG
jgi:hypothetical protein